MEDIGIVLGDLFAKALGDRRGINRAGYFVQTMDESLALVAVDLGGRPALVYDQKVDVVHVGDLQTELLEDFFEGFANHAGANFTLRLSTAVRTITRSKQSSNALPVPCAMHAQPTSV